MKGAYLLLALILLANAMGCAMCCSPYDCSYSACGGRWERTNLNSGRVGSAFEPAGDMVSHGGVLHSEYDVHPQYEMHPRPEVRPQYSAPQTVPGRSPAPQTVPGRSPAPAGRTRGVQYGR